MTDGGVYTSHYFIKRLGSGQAESLDLDFFYHLESRSWRLQPQNAVRSEGEGAPVARNGGSDRRSSQLAIEKGICSFVGECCRRGIVARPIMPREGMILTRIAVNRRV